MRAYPYMPGVPAAGHIAGGYWHPGQIEGCVKCPSTDQSTDHLPATRAQLLAISDRAMLIERECPGPYTRATAKAEIARLDARIKQLRADGTIE